MSTWHELQRDAELRLDKLGVDNPPTEAAWLLEDVSGLTGAELRADGHAEAPARAVAALASLLGRREAGEPLQYVLGHWQFRGLDLLVDPRVLIPRPETEWVVECTLDALAADGARRGTRNGWTGTETQLRVADLGTGSGAIALALAAELPDAEVWATDVSADALAVARANIAGTGTTRVRLAEGSWFTALPEELRGTFRAIISNPPYIAADTWSGLEPVVRDHEPFGALVGGPDGFEAVAEITAAALDWLEPGGLLVIEMDPDQCPRAVALAGDLGYIDIRTVRDLADRDRAIIARKERA